MNQEVLKRLIKQNKEGQKRKRKPSRPLPVQDPRALARRYQAYLLTYVRELGDLIKENLFPKLDQIIRERDWEMRLDESESIWLKLIDQTFLEINLAQKEKIQRVLDGLHHFSSEASRQNAKQLKKSLKKSLGVDIFDQAGTDGRFLQSQIDSWAEENLLLIENIPEKLMTDTKGSVQRAVKNGRRANRIKNTVKKQLDVTENRAKTIARDQISKLNASITRARSEKLGINYYVWFSSLDERTRTSHEVLHGMICDYDDDTIYSEDGVNWLSRASIGGFVGNPGDDINCRCVAAPYVSDILSEITDDEDNSDFLTYL